MNAFYKLSRNRTLKGLPIKNNKVYLKSLPKNISNDQLFPEDAYNYNSNYTFSDAFLSNKKMQEAKTIDTLQSSPPSRGSYKIP